MAARRRPDVLPDARREDGNARRLLQHVRLVVFLEMPERLEPRALALEQPDVHRDLAGPVLVALHLLPLEPHAAVKPAVLVKRRRVARRALAPDCFLRFCP
jgi:hypothetical protein